MNILALDLATVTGWALLEDGTPALVGTALRLGTRGAAEPLVCGALYRTWMEATVDRVGLGIQAAIAGQ